MNRYSKITDKIKREIVLLKAYPCIWGKCSFCDYILDNSSKEEEIIKTNKEVLKNITGEFKVLEVINSGSCFEIPKETLLLIKEIIKEKKIERLFLESHWAYKNKIKEMRGFFEIPITFKIGVETFDYEFRNSVLNKNAKFNTVEELKEYFDSPCIMVGIKGQTKEMIAKDLDILLNNFDHGTINVFVNNSTNIKRDNELVKWFTKEYKDILDKNEKIEVLYNNTDFGVGD
ncbi:MAG: radical SAM protein [Clostridiales bacterium]|nr:radical SAM protein [Clostridiales bacterium]